MIVINLISIFKSIMDVHYDLFFDMYSRKCILLSTYWKEM